MQQASNQLAQMDVVVKQHLAKSAIARYGAIKLGQPKVFIHLVTSLFDALQKNKVHLVDDQMLKRILEQINKQNNGNIQT